MEFLYLLSFFVGFPCFRVSGRAVNISSAWFLPQEGFPVFYRYFNDKVTWKEAEAVCGFHHADLLSVQTNNQMDATRAYLKEIDVTDNIWMGLQKESPEKPFSWTNGEKLLGDGYWIEPIPKTNEELCAAIDPISDFRWNSFYCRGPQVASFVCELPVPEWAKKENSCLITSLPSLTVTLLPEVGIIQLLSDCGLDGTRRIACNDGVNREETIRRLSCDLDAFASTAFTRSTTSNTVKDPNTQGSPWSSIHREETTNFYLPQTRHKRRANITSKVAEDIPTQYSKQTNAPSHGFPHSPYSAAVRNAPSTKKPKALKMKPEKPTSSSVNGTFKDLPVLIIKGERLNTSSPTSENPQIVLMIEDENLDTPFIVPLSDDIFINNPSLSPVEVINVDLVEVDNLTANGTNHTLESPVAVHSVRLLDVSHIPTTVKPDTESQTEESFNNLQEEAKGGDASTRPNRGRLLTHSNHPLFYPRFLNRVLG